MSEVVKRIQVVAAVVWDGPLLLMTQRPPGGPLGLQWEFPGGKLEPGESPKAAASAEAGYLAPPRVLAIKPGRVGR